MPDDRKITYRETDNAVYAYIDGEHVASAWGPACGSDDWFTASIGTTGSRLDSRTAAVAAMREEAERMVVDGVPA